MHEKKNHRKRSRSRNNNISNNMSNKKRSSSFACASDGDTKSPTQLRGKQLHQHRRPTEEGEMDADHRQMIHSEDDNNTNDDDSLNHKEPVIYLRWDSPDDFVPLHEEEAMMVMVLERHGKFERGMLKDKPPHVVNTFRRRMSQSAPTMTMSQLCSLRRHHIKRLNFYKRMPELRLGNESDARESARIFEDVIATYLRTKSIEYWSEQQQAEIAASENRRLVATPDFLLKAPVMLQKTRKRNNDPTNRHDLKTKRHPRHHRRDNKTKENGNYLQGTNKSHPKEDPARQQPLLESTPCGQQNQQQSDVVLEEQTIHWIEVKMFYGASTIPNGKKGGAVGTIMEKAQKYVDVFGSGAIVFMMGCGQKLADALRQIGVIVVDCSSSQEFNLQLVHDHQRTWCATEKGEILP